MKRNPFRMGNLKEQSNDGIIHAISEFDRMLCMVSTSALLGSDGSYIGQTSPAEQFKKEWFTTGDPGMRA